MQPNIVIIPGNGGSHIETDHWYAWVRDELKSRGYSVTATDMPDPVEAKMSIWLPYITTQLITHPHTIVIGHSSGAVATLRYLENHSLLGAILVGCNYTDLGYADEKAAGWYHAPWQWASIKHHARWLIQFASPDDPFIPLSEVEHIHSQLGTDLHVLPNRGHFMIDQNPANAQFPELIDLIQARSSTYKG